MPADSQKIIKIEAAEYRHLYNVLCALYECDLDPSESNSKQLIEVYKKAMKFYEGTKFPNKKK